MDLSVEMNTAFLCRETIFMATLKVWKGGMLAWSFTGNMMKEQLSVITIEPEK